MTSTAIILLIISAFTHAGWNFLSKKEHPTQAFYLIASTIGVVCMLPLLYYFRNLLDSVPALIWAVSILSGFFLATYFSALAGAYRAGDISIAYPLARSLPVLFVFIIMHALGKDQSPGGLFFLGVLLIVCGCIILPLKTFYDFHFLKYTNLCCLLAVFAALSITGYTVVDDMALRYLRALPGQPISPVESSLLYIIMQSLSCSFWQGLFVFANRRERKSLTIVFRTHKRSAAVTGVGIYLTYCIVLISMNYVSNVSYVAALRQLSIPIGALLGVVFLKEPNYLPKSLGIGIIFLGLVLAAIN